MIILINGPINSGKSTIGRLLATLLPRTAHVEVDTLRAFITSVPLDEAIPVNLENAVSVTENLVRRGFDVVVTYPLGNDDYTYLVDRFAGLDTSLHIFTLGPSLAVALSDRGERRLSEQERQRIRQQYAGGRHAPPFGRRIDNSDLTPQDTVNAIIRHLCDDE